MIKKNEEVKSNKNYAERKKKTVIFPLVGYFLHTNNLLITMQTCEY